VTLNDRPQPVVRRGIQRLRATRPPQRVRIIQVVAVGTGVSGPIVRCRVDVLVSGLGPKSSARVVVNRRLVSETPENRVRIRVIPEWVVVEDESSQSGDRSVERLTQGVSRNKVKG